MKKMKNLAVLAIMMVTCAVMFVGCGEGYSYEDLPEKVPTPTDSTTKPTPDPDPTPRDTTSTPRDTIDNTWRWSTIVARTLDFDTETKIVTANNIAELCKKNSNEVKLDSATLRYQFGLEITSPTRIVTLSKDTAVYTGKGLQRTTYGDYYRQGTDSLHTVTTVVENGIRTQYYALGVTMNRVEGYSLHAGKWLDYKNVTENAQLSALWHEPLREVELNDSIFNREVVHNVLRITLKGDKGTWTLKREKVVIVDHFLKLKEQEPEAEPEPEKVNADEWVTGLGRLVSLTKCLREDSRLWCDVALLEGSTGYTMIIDTYNTDGGYVGREKKFVSFEVCPKTNDYDGVSYVNGGFYPATITYDAKSRGWLLVSVVSGEVLKQAIDARDADARGIKNFKENNTAYPWPYLTNTSTSKEVNGKKVIEVSGKTSTRSYRGCVVADSSLKK
jgi:hypothetical protein